MTAPIPESSRPRGAKILMILGALVFIGGLVLGQTGIGRVQRVADDIRNTGDDIRNSILIEVTIPGSEPVDLEPGRYDVFAFDRYDPSNPSGTTSTISPPVTRDRTTTVQPSTGSVDPTVTISDPAGATVPTTDPGITTYFAAASGELYAISSFTVIEAGTYRVDVRGGDVSAVGVGPSLDDGKIGDLVANALLSLVAYVSAAVGAILAVAGLIWFLVSNGGRPHPGPAGLYGPTAWSPPDSWPPAGPPVGPPAGSNPWPAGPPEFQQPVGPQGPPQQWAPPPPPPGWAPPLPPPARPPAASDHRPPPPASDAP